MLIKSANKLYQVLQAGPWQGLQEVQTQDIAEPVNRWTGPKRTIAQHQQALSFLAWTHKEFKDEAMVHWFLNESEGRWQPMVLPQRGIGMTVRVLEDHANYIPTFQRLGAGWELMGTDHHHCSASAFQSGTDHADEKGKEGLHLTLGNMDKELHSLHARSSFRQTIRPVFLVDWYELPASYDILPLDLKEKALQHLLCLPTNAEFPEWWKENVIKTTGTVTVYDTRSQARSSNNNYASGTYTSKRLKGELEDFMKTFKMDVFQLAEWLEKLRSNNHLMELLKALGWCYSDIDDAWEATEDMLKEQVDLEDEELALVETDAQGNPVLDKDGNYILKDTDLEDEQSSFDPDAEGCDSFEEYQAKKRGNKALQDYQTQLLQDIADSDERVTGWYGD